MKHPKVALVTGGGKGIGKGITISLVNAGIRVIVAQRSPLDKELTEKHEVSWVQADFAEIQSINDIVNYVETEFGYLDIIINNAGVMPECKIDDLKIEDWQRTLTVNTTFPLFMIKNLLPFMKNEGSSIVNIGSIEGISANPDHTAYCTSKAALHGMTRSLAVDLGSRGIRCNAIAPGWIDTDLNHIKKELTSGRDFQTDLIKLHPAGRTGKPADIANMVRFLISDDSDFITGQIIVIDGGRTALLPLPV